MKQSVGFWSAHLPGCFSPAPAEGDTNLPYFAARSPRRKSRAGPSHGLLSPHSCMHASRTGLNMRVQHHAPLGTDFSMGENLCTDSAAWKVILTVSSLPNPEALSYINSVIIVILW